MYKLFMKPAVTSGQHLGLFINKVNPRMEDSAAGEWVWAFSNEHKQRYWYHTKSHECSWINPHQLARKRLRDSSDSNHYRAVAVSDIHEDHPKLSIEREKLLGDALDILASENTKFGEMQGETKTAKSCRKDGMKIGMQGVFARIVWFELLQQIATLGDVGTMATDSVFPNVFLGDPAVLKEFVDGGRSEDEGRAIMNAVGNSLTQSAKKLLLMKQEMIARPIITKVAITAKEINRKTIYSLDYMGVQYTISAMHLSKLLRLYSLHTDEFAHINDSLFVSSFIS